MWRVMETCIAGRHACLFPVHADYLGGIISTNHSAAVLLGQQKACGDILPEVAISLAGDQCASLT